MIHQQAIRYGAVGVLNTAAGLLCIFAALHFWGFGNVEANAFGYSAGFLISYTVNRRWTFHHRGPAGESLFKFAMVTAVAYLANLATTLAAYRIIGVNAYLAQTAGVPVYLAFGFLGSRYFAFAPPSKSIGNAT
jgi:putative flippase GtrA